MSDHILKQWFGRLIPYSLKYRLLIVLIFSTVIPLALIGVLSYQTIYSIQQNKLQNGIQSSLNQLDLEFINCMNNLNYTSQQLAFEGNVVDDIQSLLISESPYQTALMTQKMRDTLNLISYTNLQLGLIFYYSPDNNKKLSFENSNVRPDFSFTDFSILSSQTGATYFGLHRTLNKYNNNMVFGILRRVAIPDSEIYIYIETDYKWFNNMLKNTGYGMNVVHFITDVGGNVIFSENSGEIPEGSYYSGKPIYKSGAGNSYHVFASEGDNEYGWRVLTAVDIEDFSRESRDWVRQFALFAMISLCISVFFAWVVWRTIYSPLRLFNNEILLIENSEFDSPVKTVRNKEFDQLFLRFRHMAINIKKLIRTVEQKERLKSSLEAEKLRYKINPHFLHNTLDTVRWLARAQGQDDIDRLVSSLNRVLHYNLGKLGEITTVGEEIDVLDDYASIQKAKYDFEFVVDVDETVRSIPAPRFILQPLVENALLHGFRDNMTIRVEARPWGDCQTRIVISDDGSGMPEQTLALISRADSSIPPFGVGLNYVRSTVNIYYGDEANLDIRGAPGHGTTIALILPNTIQTDKEQG